MSFVNINFETGGRPGLNGNHRHCCDNKPMPECRKPISLEELRDMMARCKKPNSENCGDKNPLGPLGEMLGGFLKSFLQAAFPGLGPIMGLLGSLGGGMAQAIGGGENY